jgi:hypothetical protein
MIEERKRMMHYRSHSTDSLNQRSRTPSHDDDADDDDEDFNESDTNVTKRRIRKKKKQQNKNQVNDDDVENNRNFDNSRRRLSRYEY